MAMKILIGYDGSVDADGALHDLSLAGLPAKAEARVITATTPWVMFAPEGQIPPGLALQYGVQSKEALKEARGLAERAAASLRRNFPGWTVRSQAVLGDPAQGLLDSADRWKPDLIVMGSHGRSALGRLLVGSTSQHVLHYAKASVRITRPRIRSKQGPPRILVSVDGSVGAEAALEAVASRAWPKGSRFLVLGLFDANPMPGAYLGEGAAGFAATVAVHRRAVLEKAVTAAAERLERKGLSAQGMVREGDPRAALVDEARDWGADSLFLGSRGLGAWDRILLGSVSSTMASHAPCTVEVIRNTRARWRAKSPAPRTRKRG